MLHLGMAGIALAAPGGYSGNVEPADLGGTVPGWALWLALAVFIVVLWHTRHSAREGAGGWLLGSWYATWVILLPLALGAFVLIVLFK